MSKWGNFDFSEFEKFAKGLERAQKQDVIGKFIEDFLVEMANRALRKIKKRTPVGRGTPDPGNLRRNWQVGNVVKQGDTYSVELFNDTAYALFVEYGHRAGKENIRWVEGRFMMTISMKEMEREMPRYLEKRVNQLLNDILNGRG